MIQKTFMEKEKIHLTKGIQKEIETEIMKAYYCIIHNIHFYRNIKKNYGRCGLCKSFDSEIHFSLDSEKYKKGYKRSDNMAWEKEEGMNFLEWTKEDQEVVGKLKEKMENFGENNSNVYVVEQEDGKLVSIWGTGFLDNLMVNVKINDKIKVVFIGLGKPSKKGYSPPKLFSVFIDR